MNELHQVVSASPLDDKRIRVAFENGVEGTFDCSRYMSHPFWKRLSDPAFFRLVRAECGTLVWPDDVDIDPEEVWEDCKKDVPPSSALASVSSAFCAAEPAAQYDAAHSRSSGNARPGR